MTQSLIKHDFGNAFVWADATDYSSSASGLTRTSQIDLTSLADAAAREGDKADLGSTQAARYAVYVGIEMDVAATSGTVVDFYWAPSVSSTAANANPGGCSGSDGAYTGTAGDSLDDSVKQLEYLGSLVLTADIATTVQYEKIAEVDASVIGRYGMPVVYNNGGQAFEGDAVEMFVALVPIIDET